MRQREIPVVLVCGGIFNAIVFKQQNLPEERVFAFTDDLYSPGRKVRLARGCGRLSFLPARTHI